MKVILESTSGVTGCGFGPPALPFFYKSPELLMHRSKVCVTLSRGTAAPAKHCICNTHRCNDLFQSHPLFGFSPAQRSRSVTVYYTDVTPKIHECISCDVASHDSTVTSGCKQNKCYGHYCTFTTQRIVISGFTQRMASQAIIHEKQGCINVTNHKEVQLGCMHKWMNNEEEELACLCRGDNCNADLHTASLSNAKKSKPQIIYVLWILPITFIFS
jgi:hypothetical protein